MRTKQTLVPFLLLVAYSVAADPPQPERSDEPLPVGAVKRLGTLRLRHSGMSDFAVLPNGRNVLTTGGDGHLRTWDMANGKLTRSVRLQPPEGDHGLLSVSPDGQTYAECRPDRITIWNAATGAILKTFPGPNENPTYLWLSPDGQTLATGTFNPPTVRLFESKTGKERVLELPPFQFNPGSPYHGRWSPDGKRFAAGGGQRQPFCVFDVATGDVVQQLDCHAAASVFTADGRQVIVSSIKNDQGENESVIRHYDLDSGRQVAAFPQGHNTTYYALALTPDNKTLACGRSDGGCLMEVATGRIIRKLSDYSVALEFSRDGSTLIYHTGNKLRVLDTKTGQDRFESTRDFGFQPIMAVSPDGKWLASADWTDKSVAVWELASGRLDRELPMKNKQERYVIDLRFSSDSRSLTATQSYGFVHVWDVATGAEREQYHLADPNFPNGDTWSYYRLRVTEKGRRAASLNRVFADNKESARLLYWDVAGRDIQHEIPIAQTNPASAWLADATRVALPLEGGIAIIDIASGQHIIRIPDVPGAGRFAVSPDDRLLAARRKRTADKDEVIDTVVFELATGTAVATLPAGIAAHIAFSPDGRTLITTDATALRIWDLATGAQILHHALPATEVDSSGRTFVRRMVVTPDGRQAITALGDGTALLWNIAMPVTVAALSPEELATAWAELADADAGRAYRAVARLSAAPPDAVVGYIRQHLKPAADMNAELIRALIRDLDSDLFGTRERATKELTSLGAVAIPAVCNALAKSTSAEVRRRLESIMKGAPQPVVKPEDLRGIRAVQVLERLASDDARALLTELARGVEYAPQTNDAKAALERLTRQAIGPR